METWMTGVPGSGTLYLERELFTFEGIPMAFVCMDEERGRYLCLCTGCMGGMSYLAVPVTGQELLDVLDDACTLLAVFKEKPVLVAECPRDGKWECRWAPFGELDPMELPAADQYLGQSDMLTEYREQVAK